MAVKNKVGAEAPTGETKTESNELIKTALITNIFKILCLISLVVLLSGGAAGYETYNVTEIWKWKSDESNSATYTLEVADMDGDGIDEIIAGSVDKKLRIFKNTGDNNYTVIWDSGTNNLTVVDIAIADMYGDGKKDMVIAALSHDSDVVYSIYLFKNNGKNNYTRFWDSGSFFKDFVENVAIGDTDGDGKNEIVAGCYDNRTYIFKKVDNNYALVWNSTSLGTNVFVAVGDFNGDGKDEISAIGDNIYIFENIGNSNYEVAWEGNLTLDRDSYNPMRIHAEDIDGDGKEEIIAYGMDIYGFKNTARNNYSLIWKTRQGANHRDLKMADLDGDGKKEIVSGMFRLFIFKSDREGEYKLLWTDKNKLDIESISIGDVDGDNRKELIIGTRNGGWGNIYVFGVENVTENVENVTENVTNATENVSVVEPAAPEEKDLIKQIIDRELKFYGMPTLYLIILGVFILIIRLNYYISQRRKAKEE